MEYRAFEYIFGKGQDNINGFNKNIIQRFGSIQNYFISFINDMNGFLNYVFTEFYKLHGYSFTFNTKKLRYGLEIETCFDMKKKLSSAWV